MHAVYWGPDGGREFALQVEGKDIATPKLVGGKDDFYGVEYPIAEALLAGKDKVTVRFQARPGESAGPLYDLRVITLK